MDEGICRPQNKVQLPLRHFDATQNAGQESRPV
jgi:hypothetical protein